QEGFCPVELYVPEATPGPKADIFEMGALLYRYVTGETVMPYYERINEEKVPTEPKDMKTRVMDFQSDAIMKAVELYDFDRFSTLDELLAELAPADMDLDSLHDLQEEARNFKKAPLKYRREQQFKWGYIIAIAAMAVFLVIFLIPRVVVVSDTVKIDRFYRKFHQASEYEKCLMLSKLTKEQRDNYTNNYRDLPGDVTEEEQSKLLSVRYYDYILKHYVPISQVDRKRPGYEYVKIDLRSNTAVVTYIAAEGDVEEEYKLKPFIDGSYQVIKSYTDESGKKQSDTLIVNENSPK
nr:hypothetical protein [Lachnospiraceae bacterium]